MPKSTSNISGNRLLAILSPADGALIRQHLEPVDIALRQTLEPADQPIKHAYFVDTGLASVVAMVGGDRDVEVGIIGREGVTGIAVILGNDRSPHTNFVQLAGTAQRISAANLRRVMGESASLHALLLRWTQAFNVQTAQTAVTNARGNLEQRLARWLLIAHDRVDGDDLGLTHEFLALMLGVRRAGVTVAVHAFEQKSLINSRRALITILDREGIEERREIFTACQRASGSG